MDALVPVFIAAAIVFAINLVGSIVKFKYRFVNALVDTAPFAVVFGALVHLGESRMAFALKRIPLKQARAWHGFGYPASLCVTEIQDDQSQ